MDISSLTVAGVVVSCMGSSSSSDDAESIASKGFLKLSTVSQNWTSNDLWRRSINSIKYESELGLLRTSRSTSPDFVPAAS